MGEKSRVVFYEEHRKKISNIDTYSFVGISKSKEVSNVLQKDKDHSEPVKQDDGIKRNTFSMSIDELIRQSDQYSSKTQDKEIKSLYNEKKKKNIRKNRFSLSKIIIWSAVSIVIIVFLVLLILILTGVI